MRFVDEPALLSTSPPFLFRLSIGSASGDMQPVARDRNEIHMKAIVPWCSSCSLRVPQRWCAASNRWVDGQKRRFFTFVCVFQKSFLIFNRFVLRPAITNINMCVCVHARFVLVYRANHFRVHWHPHSPVPRLFATTLHTPIGNDRVTIARDCMGCGQNDRYQSDLVCVDSNDTLHGNR